MQLKSSMSRCEREASEASERLACTLPAAWIQVDEALQVRDFRHRIMGGMLTDGSNNDPIIRIKKLQDPISDLGCR